MTYYTNWAGRPSPYSLATATKIITITTSGDLRWDADIGRAEPAPTVHKIQKNERIPHDILSHLLSK